MKMKFYSLCIASMIVIGTAFAPVLGYAQDQIEIVGIITDVQGQRLEIEIESGERIWVTTKQPISDADIGHNISGHYIAIADTYLLVDSTLDEQ